MNTLSFDSQEKYNLCLFFTIYVLNIYKYIQVVIAEEDVIEVVILYYENFILTQFLILSVLLQIEL